MTDIHSTAIVEDGVKLGEDVRIGPESDGVAGLLGLLTLLEGARNRLVVGLEAGEVVSQEEQEGPRQRIPRLESLMSRTRKKVETCLRMVFREGCTRSPTT